MQKKQTYGDLEWHTSNKYTGLNFVSRCPRCGANIAIHDCYDGIAQHCDGEDVAWDAYAFCRSCVAELTTRAMYASLCLNDALDFVESEDAILIDF